MEKSSLFKPFKSFYRIVKFKTQSFLFDRLIKSSNAWQLFDKAGIAGFGVNLLRLYFPVYYDKKTARQSFSSQLQKHVTTIITNNDKPLGYNNSIIDQLNKNASLPVKETDGIMPYLDNYYFGIMDAAVLFAIMQNHNPQHVVEIGSGISTRYMRYFKDQLGLNTKITCIDPVPRVNIKNVADTVIAQPLENVISNNIFNLKSGDIIFLDGSHYVFQGNDTVTFFFKLLPSLPAGVIIHIHDIYLPFDYSESVEQQLWSEQYLLAALIQGGFKGFETLYPAYYMSQTNNEIKQALIMANSKLDHSKFSLKISHKEGYSFWFRTI